MLGDRGSNDDGKLDQSLYVLGDINFNVTVIVDKSVKVVERYVYNPFGQITILTGTRVHGRLAWSHRCICTKADGSTLRAACIISAIAITRQPWADGPTSIRNVTKRWASIYSGC